MYTKDFIALLYKKKGLIASSVLIFFTISAVFTAVQPFNYRASVRLMVVQEFSKETDPYSMAKSNQYISTILVNIISSSLFYDKVLSSKFDVGRDYFSDITKSEVQKWNEAVYTGAVDDTGIISINVLHVDKYQAEEIARAITDNIKSGYREYYKVPQTIEIKVLDNVSVSNFPVEPNVVMNLVAGIVFGIISSFCYIYIFAEKIRQKLLSENSEKQKNIFEKKKNKARKKSILFQGKQKNKKPDIKIEEKAPKKITQEVARSRRVVEKINKVKKDDKQPINKKTGFTKEEYKNVVKKGDISNLFG